MSRAAMHPTLPQNDDPNDQQKRVAQLATTCESYVWTTTVTSLPGVPLATTVPFNDEPTIEWLGIVLGVSLAIVRNVIAVKLSGAEKQVATLLAGDLQRCDEIEKSAAALTNPPAAPAKVGFLGEIKHGIGEIKHGIGEIAHDVGEVADGVVEAAEQGIGDLAERERASRLRAYLDELRELADKHTDGVADAVSQRNYEALFATLPLPTIASTFLEDSTFALLRVAGPNPMLLTGIHELPTHFPVSAETYQKVMGSGDSLERALGEGRVYLLDYADLEALVPGTWQGLPKFPYAPLALFAVPVGGTSLQPVAIQCGQDPAQQPIFTPASSGPDQWGWEMAKTVVQFADGNYHELYVHLARTHLVMEAFAVATRRELADVHPLWALLIPHFEGSLFINNAAAKSLIAVNGPIDHIFAGTITSSQSTAAGDRLAFDFYGRIPPADLAARKVDDVGRLPDYPYRDDALLVWQALHAWAEQYIGIYYASDAAVTGDFELAAWAQALASDGKIKGFGAITTRKQLVDVCAMIMFTGSAQHAAVNFPQKDIMTYAPAVTGAGWTAAPALAPGHTRPEWLGYLPPISLAMEQLNLLYLLGSVHYRPLGDYRSNDLPYPQWFRDPAVTTNALPRFQAALKEVEAKIVARNRERRSPYTYLQPSLIPTSINI